MRLVSRMFSRGATALLGCAVAVTAYSGGVVGMDSARAQSSACECVVSATTVGVVQSVRGNVFVGSEPAQANMRLQPGSSVVVGPRSASTIRFGRNCTLRLRANSVVEVRPQQGQLCLALNEQAAPGGAGGTAAAGIGGKFLGPGLLIGGLGAGALIFATSDKDKCVSAC